jgi:hypothetical protein
MERINTELWRKSCYNCPNQLAKYQFSFDGTLYQACSKACVKAIVQMQIEDW